jgi:hypothetical protein
MTLVEVIVAAAIIAIVSLAVFSTFSTVLNTQKQDFDSKSEAENVEEQIASGGTPSSSTDVTLKLPGGIEMRGKADTFTDGQRSYTIFEGIPESEMALLLFGDGAETLGGVGTGENGGSTKFTTPEEGYYRIEVWGATGGDGSDPRYDYGGKGGYAAGTVWLSKGQDLLIYVGGTGKRGNGAAGGKNGGGAGAQNVIPEKNIGSGGGETDICAGLGYANYRIIVAGGGGGGGAYYEATSTVKPSERGGNGGGPTGEDGSGDPLYTGKGGTQLAGGALPAKDAESSTAGVFGDGGTTKGGTTTSTSRSGGGGGAGWYGGSPGSQQGGGGGSGFVLTKDSVVPSSYFSGEHHDPTKFYFEESTVVNVRIGQTGYQPHPGGTAARGGFARITYLGWRLS